jgi:hypothetical protein
MAARKTYGKQDAKHSRYRHRIDDDVSIPKSEYIVEKKVENSGNKHGAQ